METFKCTKEKCVYNHVGCACAQCGYSLDNSEAAFLKRLELERAKFKANEDAIKTELDHAKEKAFNAHKAAQRAALQVELIRTKLLRFRAANGMPISL